MITHQPLHASVIRIRKDEKEKLTSSYLLHLQENPFSKETLIFYNCPHCQSLKITKIDFTKVRQRQKRIQRVDKLLFLLLKEQKQTI